MIYWTNTLGGLWNVAANWSPNQVPASTNIVLINTPGTYTVTLNVNASPDSLTIGNAGSGVQTLQTSGFNLGATNTFVSSNGVLSLTNSTITGAFSVAAAGVFQVNEVTMESQVTVMNGGEMLAVGAISSIGQSGVSNNPNYYLWIQNGAQMNANTTMYVYAPVTNSGICYFTNGGFNMENTFTNIEDGGVVNLTTGVINLFNDAGIVGTGAGCYTINQGTITATNGISQVNVGLSQMTGTFDAATGARIYLESTATGGTSPGAGLDLTGSGTCAFYSGLLILPSNTIPDLEMIGGALELGTNFQGGEITNLTLDGITYTNSLPLNGTLVASNNTSLLGSIVVPGGSVFSAFGAFIDAQVTVENGGEMVLLGSSYLGDSGYLGDSNCWISLQSGAVLNAAPYSTLVLYAPMTNSGTCNMTNSGFTIYNNGSIGELGVLVNQPGGVINLFGSTSGDILCEDGFASLLNLGTINVVSGTSYINLGVALLTGTYDLSVGANVEFATAGATNSTSAGPGFIVEGGGYAVFYSGELTLASNTIPNLALTGGTLLLGSNFQGGAITNLILDGITLSNTLPVAGRLIVTNSVLRGSFAVSNGGAMQVDGAFLEGQVTVENGGEMQLIGSPTYLGDGGTTSNNTNYWLWVQSGGQMGGTTLILFAPMTNSGTCFMTNGGFEIYNIGTGNEAGELVNQTNAVINLFGGAGITCENTDAFMVNEGIINVADFSSSVNVGSALLTGTYNAQIGATVQLGANAGPGTSAGTNLVFGGGGQFEFNQGTLTLPSNTIPGLVMTGGTLVLGSNFQGGAITNLTLAGIDLSNSLPVTGMLFATNIGYGCTLTGTYVVGNGALLCVSDAALEAQVTVESGGEMRLVEDISAIGGYSYAANTNCWLLLQSGAQLNGSADLYLYSPMTNAGSCNMTNNYFEIFNNGTAGFDGSVVNLTNGVLNLFESAGIIPAYAGGYLLNEGTIKVGSSGNTSIIYVNYFTNTGTLSAQHGTLELEGANLALMPAGTLSVGLNSASDFGVIQLSNGLPSNLAQDGTLLATLNNGFLPAVNNSFQVLTYASGTTGAFADTNLPAAATWQTTYGATALTLKVIALHAGGVQFTASPTNGLAPLTVNFTSPASDSASNAIIGWSWKFGDGSGTSTNQNPAYTYTNAGTFFPSLIVTNVNNVSIAATGPSVVVGLSNALFGTAVTGTLQFYGVGSNYFDPANGSVPAGFANSISPTFTLGAGSNTFGYQNEYDTDTATFVGSTLTVTDIMNENGADPWTMTFTDAAFTGITSVFDNFINGGINASVSGGVITLAWAGSYSPSYVLSGTYVAVFDLNSPGGNPIMVTLASPTNGQAFTAPATITLAATTTNFSTNATIGFYIGNTLLGSNTSPPYSFTVSNVAAGTYAFAAVATDTNGSSATSSVAYVTVNNPGTALIDFDPLADVGSVTGNPTLANYLAQFGLTLTNNSLPGTSVVAENQTNVAGGGFVIASSPPNVLTQIGSNGPVSFTVGFSNLLTQFSFTRPELLANPFVTHPAWQAQAFDSLGILLDSTNAPQISSFTNVPAQTYTLSGAGISSVEFSSEGTGLNTFNAMLLDNFVLTDGTSANLPPSVMITNPTNGQIFTNAADIPIDAAAAPGTGVVTNVAFFINGTLAGSSQSSPFSISWSPPGNGGYALTAVAVNNSGLSSTSAPVSITVASGFAILTPPVSQTIGVGLEATFTVTSTGTNAAYQWQFNGANVAGATNSSFTLSNAPVSLSGSYAVVIVSGGQSVTSAPAALLTVLGPPTLSSPLISTNVVGHSTNITLSVSASDPVPYYYQWQLNGNGIAGTASGGLVGSNTISYTITNAGPFDSGDYQVVVANSVASVESEPFDVEVSYGALITTNDTFASSLAFNPLTNGVSGINSSTSLPPTTGLAHIAGKPAAGLLFYNWTASFSGVISLTTRGSTFDTLMGVYTGTNVNTLTPVGQDDDSGGDFTSLVTFNCTNGIKYQIVVAGYQGATGTVELGISPGPPLLPGPANGYSVGGAQPVILTNPASQIVQSGATVTNAVVATGATGYQWYFAGAPVAGGNGSSLIISNFTSAAVGNYFVQVTNAVGSVQSTTVTIQIASENQNGTPTKLLEDKFGDAVDLTAAAPDRYRPTDSGGETGGFTLSQSFSTVGATKEEGEPNHAGQPGGASYWYSYTATNSGTVTFTTAGSTFNTILAVYSGPGTSFSTLSNVGAAFTTNYVQQGQPTVALSNVVAGTKLFIAIDGYQGASGAAKLNIVLDPVPLAVDTNAVSITNNTPVVAITSPANDSLTTGPIPVISVKGTVKGSNAKAPADTVVQLSLNNIRLGLVTLQGTSWTTNVTLTSGLNTITAQSITAEGSNNFVSLPVTRTVFYDAAKPSPALKTPVTLLTSGQGKITGQADQALLEIGKIYAVKAVPIGNNVFANWNSGTSTNSLTPLTSGATLAFDMYTNLILQAVFITNPFTGLGGVYNGLFSPAGSVTEQCSGFLTATLENKVPGAYSAKLLLDGGSYSFSGAFDLSLSAQAIVPRTGNTSVTVAMQLGTNDQLTGSVSENASNGWTSQLTADLAVFSKSSPTTNYNGSYTLVIPPGGATNEPGGYGYATLTTSSAGAVAISGSLADKTTFNQSVTVSRDGYVPLYVSLYSKKGSLQGWLGLTNEDSSGQAQTILGAGVAWIKTNVPKSLYAAGFTNTSIAVLGSLYTNKFTLTGGTLTIGDGIGPNLLTYTNVTIAGNKLSVAGGAVTGAIASGTGVLSLTIKPAGGHSLSAKGVVLEDGAGTNGAGWFPGTNESGFFLLQP